MITCLSLLTCLSPHLSVSLFSPVSLPTCLSFSLLSVSEDSVGLRRILSQSTESLNFRSRTLSMESLTDDGVFVVSSRRLLLLSVLVLIGVFRVLQQVLDQ